MKSFADYMGEPHDVRAPFKFAMTTTVQTDEADVGAGGASVSSDLVEYLPDNVVYEIDDVRLIATEAFAIAGGTAPTVSVGLLAANGNVATGLAIDTKPDYFLATETITDGTAIGAEVAVEQDESGDLDWAATADSTAKRQINGPALLYFSAGQGNGGGATGKFILKVRYHVVSSVKYPMMDESDHGNSQP